MKVYGFSFVRNAIKYDYPVVAALRSILPLCDEIVVAVGQSEDDTRALISSIDPSKIRIIDTVWDEQLRKGGRVLAQETNKALRAISSDAHWAFYIQADEVVHEDDYEAIWQAMQRWKDDRRVEGLLFDYLHFYGSYDYVGASTRWYRREVRIVRNDPAIFSYRDAQGFRKKPNRKLRVKRAHARIFHYGWVKDPVAMQRKQEDFNKLWHDDEWIARHVVSRDAFDYSAIDALARFEGTHPAVMQTRIQQRNWQFDFDPTRKQLSLKERLRLGIERLTGWRPGEYRNYVLLK